MGGLNLFVFLLSYLVLMHKFELFIPWWLENRYEIWSTLSVKQKGFQHGLYSNLFIECYVHPMYRSGLFGEFRKSGAPKKIQSSRATKNDAEDVDPHFQKQLSSVPKQSPQRSLGTPIGSNHFLCFIAWAASLRLGVPSRF